MKLYKDYGNKQDMPINASYEYFNAEKAYHAAQTPEERILALEEMIRKAPHHKGSENLLAELKTRLKKFREKQEKLKKASKGKKGVKKEGFQIVLLGLTNAGKSSLLSILTNARPIVSEKKFTTKEPIIGTFLHKGIKAQIVDLPSIGSEFFDLGIINTANLILIVITSLQEMEQITPLLKKTEGKSLYVLNKTDLLSSDQLRKLEANIQSKKLPVIPISCYSQEKIEFLKEKIISLMQVIRIYTKEPGKPPATQPMILPQGATVKDAGESIRNGFSKSIRETRVSGPSSKFANQKVGLSHTLKDQDIIEFHTN